MSRQLQKRVESYRIRTDAVFFGRIVEIGESKDFRYLTNEGGEDQELRGRGRGVPLCLMKLCSISSAGLNLIVPAVASQAKISVETLLRDGNRLPRDQIPRR